MFRISIITHWPFKKSVVPATGRLSLSSRKQSVDTDYLFGKIFFSPSTQPLNSIFQEQKGSEVRGTSNKRTSKEQTTLGASRHSTISLPSAPASDYISKRIGLLTKNKKKRRKKKEKENGLEKRLLHLVCDSLSCSIRWRCQNVSIECAGKE